MGSLTLSPPGLKGESFTKLPSEFLFFFSTMFRCCGWGGGGGFIPTYMQPSKTLLLVCVAGGWVGVEEVGECLCARAEGGSPGGSEKTEGGEARCGCGPLTLLQGADTDKLRLVRQGSLPPLYSSLSPARLLSLPLMVPICLWLPACLTV